MGSSFKSAIFEEHVQEGLVGWAQKVKKRKGWRGSNKQSVSKAVESVSQSSMGIQLHTLVVQNDSLTEEVKHEPLDANVS